MPKSESLDNVLRRVNDGVLPSTEDTFVKLFVQVYTDHAAHGLSNPFTTGRPGSTVDSRVRVRFHWNGSRRQLPGFQVRDARTTSDHIMPRHATSCHALATSCHIMPHHATPCPALAASHRATSFHHHSMLCHAIDTSCHIMPLSRSETLVLPPPRVLFN